MRQPVVKKIYNLKIEEGENRIVELSSTNRNLECEMSVEGRAVFKGGLKHYMLFVKSILHYDVL